MALFGGRKIGASGGMALAGYQPGRLAQDSFSLSRHNRLTTTLHPLRLRYRNLDR
jgi:hypothetical protein